MFLFVSKIHGDRHQNIETLVFQSVDKPQKHKSLQLSTGNHKFKVAVVMKRPRSSQTSRTTGKVHKAIATDRISDLPESIIHNILSFLPTVDAARTTALSKRFRFAWTSFPIIDFNYIYFEDLLSVKSEREQFLNFISDSLRRRAPNICVEKFKLHVKLDNIVSDSRVNGAIEFAIEHKVKVLDLDVGSHSPHYKLPPILFPVNSIKVLKLKGFNLETLDLTKFPSSEELSLVSCRGLKDLKVSNANLQSMHVHHCRGLLQIDIFKSNLNSFSFKGNHSHRGYKECTINLAHCESLVQLALEGSTMTCESFNEDISKLVLLENLRLSDCHRLKRLYIPNNSKLKAVEINSCAGLEKIEIFAANLESFVYNGQFRACDIMITACKFLRNLELHRVNVTDWWVEKHVSELPFLENLQLCHCDMLRRLVFSHGELKSFKLIRCSEFEKALICAPNLTSFRYDGEVIHSPLIVDSPHLEAELILNPSPRNTDRWYKELRSFLGYFDHCKSLILHCREEFLIFPKDLREILLPPLFDIKHIKVKVFSPPTEIIGLVDSLLWLSPLPETISIVVSAPYTDKYLKFQYANLLATEKMDQLCCHSRIIKCWRHSLKKVSMENFHKVDSEMLTKYFRREAMRLERIESI